MFRSGAFGILWILTVYPGYGMDTSANLSTLRVAQVLFRHGSRSIERTVPTDPYISEEYWTPGYAQVNNLGKWQGYHLGKYLRQRYNGFIKETYDMKELYVQSSDMPRTIQTAYSVLAGFYLPNELGQDEKPLQNDEKEIELPWKSVPVHSVPFEFDNVLRQKCRCPRYTQILRDHLASKPVTNEQTLVFKIMTEYGGYEEADMNLFATFYDALEVEHYLNMSLPPWTDLLLGTGLGEQVLVSFLMNGVTTPEMRRLHTGPLLQTILKNMRVEELQFENEFERSVNGQKKLYLLSGHDFTIINLLHTLDIHDGKRPAYCSAVIIELHQHQSEQFVEIFYKNDSTQDPNPLHIPACGYPCSLAKFQEIINPLIPSHWLNECEVSNYPNVQYGWTVLTILTTLWIVLCLLLLYWTLPAFKSSKIPRTIQESSSYERLA